MAKRRVEKDVESNDDLKSTISNIGTALKNTFAPTQEVAQQRRQAVAEVFTPKPSTPAPSAPVARMPSNITTPPVTTTKISYTPSAPSSTPVVQTPSRSSTPSSVAPPGKTTTEVIQASLQQAMKDFTPEKAVASSPVGVKTQPYGSTQPSALPSAKPSWMGELQYTNMQVTGEAPTTGKIKQNVLIPSNIQGDTAEAIQAAIMVKETPSRFNLDLTKTPTTIYQYDRPATSFETQYGITPKPSPVPTSILTGMPAQVGYVSGTPSSFEEYFRHKDTSNLSPAMQQQMYNQYYSKYIQIGERPVERIAPLSKPVTIGGQDIGIPGYNPRSITFNRPTLAGLTSGSKFAWQFLYPEQRSSYKVKAEDVALTAQKMEGTSITQPIGLAAVAGLQALGVGQTSGKKFAAAEDTAGQTIAKAGETGLKWLKNLGGGEDYKVPILGAGLQAASEDIRLKRKAEGYAKEQAGLETKKGYAALDLLKGYNSGGTEALQKLEALNTKTAELNQKVEEHQKTYDTVVKPYEDFLVSHAISQTQTKEGTTTYVLSEGDKAIADVLGSKIPKNFNAEAKTNNALLEQLDKTKAEIDPQLAAINKQRENFSASNNAIFSLQQELGSYKQQELRAAPEATGKGFLGTGVSLERASILGSDILSKVGTTGANVALLSYLPLNPAQAAGVIPAQQVGVFAGLSNVGGLAGSAASTVFSPAFLSKAGSVAGYVGTYGLPAVTGVIRGIEGSKEALGTGRYVKTGTDEAGNPTYTYKGLATTMPVWAKAIYGDPDKLLAAGDIAGATKAKQAYDKTLGAVTGFAGGVAEARVATDIATKGEGAILRGKAIELQPGDTRYQLYANWKPWSEEVGSKTLLLSRGAGKGLQAGGGAFSGASYLAPESGSDYPAIFQKILTDQTLTKINPKDAETLTQGLNYLTAVRNANVPIDYGTLNPAKGNLGKLPPDAQKFILNKYSEWAEQTTSAKNALLGVGPQEFGGSNVLDASGLLKGSAVRARTGLGDTDIIFRSGGPQEAQKFANELGGVLQKSGWKVDYNAYTGEINAINPKGVDVGHVTNILSPDTPGAALQYTPWGTIPKTSPTAKLNVGGGKTVDVVVRNPVDIVADKLQATMGGISPNAEGVTFTSNPKDFKSAADFVSTVTNLGKPVSSNFASALSSRFGPGASIALGTAPTSSSVLTGLATATSATPSFTAPSSSLSSLNTPTSLSALSSKSVSSISGFSASSFSPSSSSVSSFSPSSLSSLSSSSTSSSASKSSSSSEASKSSVSSSSSTSDISSISSSSSSSASPSAMAGIPMAGAGFPSLGMLPFGVGAMGAEGRGTIRGSVDNPLKNLFFERAAQETKFGALQKAKPAKAKPIPTGDLKFNLKITDMMGTTVAKKSGRIGKTTKSISIRTSKMPTEDKGRIVSNTTPFNVKETKRSVGKGFGEQFGYSPINLAEGNITRKPMPTTTNKMLPKRPNMLTDISGAKTRAAIKAGAI